MKILVARTRASGSGKLLQYQVLIPFEELSAERQNRVYTRSDYGFPGHLYAHTADVIAPMSHLNSDHGFDRYYAARPIHELAKRIDGALTRYAYPEMTDEIIPILFRAEAEHDSASVWIEVNDLTAAFATMTETGQPVNAEALNARPGEAPGQPSAD